MMEKSNVIAFAMDEVESKRARDWCESQIAKSKADGIVNRDCTGARFSFSFMPCSIGQTVVVRDEILKEEENVTNFDNW